MKSERRVLTLKRGKERVIANRHPWIFAGAIHAERGPEDAALADLIDSDGARLASGFYSKRSQIRLRALAFDGEEVTPDLIAARIRAAAARRAAILGEHTNCVRLVNAEGDELSGLVVDRYADMLVVEIANRGVEQFKDLIVETLGGGRVYFKNDLPARKLEELPTRDELWSDGRLRPSNEDAQVGTARDSTAEAAVAPRKLENDASVETRVLENGLKFLVDPAEGQKTGFFLDQRENRALARSLARGRRVLNLFSYSGAFGVYAAAGGAASVENVDVSAKAIDLARRNHELNGFDGAFTVADAFQFVRQRRDPVDLLICDPPAFAKSRGDVERAARGYKDVNLHAMRMVAPGGHMLTFSCSGHMSLDLFQKVIFAAALDAGRRVSFVRRLTAGPDHPVSMYCPEGEYLKGFLLEVR